MHGYALPQRHEMFSRNHGAGDGGEVVEQSLELAGATPFNCDVAEFSRADIHLNDAKPYSFQSSPVLPYVKCGATARRRRWSKTLVDQFLKRSRE